MVEVEDGRISDLLNLLEKARAQQSANEGRKAKLSYDVLIEALNSPDMRKGENEPWANLISVMVFSDTANDSKQVMEFAAKVILAYPCFKPAVDYLDTILRLIVCKRLKKLRKEAGFAENEPLKRRSIIFINNAYYNYLNMAAELRNRGWDALLVSFEPPDDNNRFIAFGEDLNFHSYPKIMEIWQESLVRTIPGLFSMVHTYGKYILSMKSFWGGSDGKEFILKRYGVKFGWLPSGCHETVRPSFFNQWTDGVCEKFCKHHNNPNVCSDAASISAAEYLVGNADIVEAGAFSYDLTVGANCIHVPLTAAIDSKTRSPDLFIPEEYRISRDPDEMLVFHAIGNQAIRMESTKNIKGTYYLLEAIDRLRSEGYKIRHLGVEPNTHNNILRYIMAQADVVLDHLVFGRLGATGREGMMLGKPVMTYLIHNPPMPPSPMKTREIPIVQTGIDTVYDVLKDLYHHPEKRVEIGLKGREFVVEWFSTERCADRLTAAYDRVMEGKSLHPQEDWA